MAAKRRKATRGKTKLPAARRKVVRHTLASIAVAGVLFGGGVGVGAWLAGGGAEQTTSASRSEPAASAHVPETSKPVAAQAIPKPRDIPLPKMETAVAALKREEPASVETPRPTATPPSENRDLPAWRRFAAAAEVPSGAPVIAIVLDDLGIDKRRSRRAVSLPAPITLAYLPYAEGLEEQTAEARGRGHELLVHMPMQPHGVNSDPGPNVLDMRLGAIEVLTRLEWNLDRFSGYVGVNNHMGSLFTESEEGMRLVAEGLRDRGLMFLDSLTSSKSVAAGTAESLGVPTTTRDVFLDNTDTAAEVEMRLEQTERVARKTGTAIAIGHPRDATLNVLADWIPKARAAGFALVPLTAVLDIRRGDATQQASRP